MATPITSLPLAPSGSLVPFSNPEIQRPSFSADSGESFSGVLSGALREANAVQTQADDAITRMVTGQGGELHQVMSAMEQARLSLMMVVEVRNKLVEAYQEVARMPM